MIKIVNKPCLPYKIIGKAMDMYIDYSPEDTLYEGKIDVFTFKYQATEYEVCVRYLKRDVVWYFKEVGDINE